MDMYPYIPPAYKHTSKSPLSSKPPYSHPQSFTSNPSPFPPSLTMSNNHASSSRAIATPSPLTPLSSHPSSSGSCTNSKRPHLNRKAHSSSTAKQRGVQASLEAQVEKYRGWQAFFLPAKPVPNVPPSSPVLGAVRQEIEVDMDLELEGGDDSDLSRTTSNSSHGHQQQQCAMGLPMGFGTEAMQLQNMGVGAQGQGKTGGENGQNEQAKAKGIDYFGQWKKREEWVEDVDVTME